MVCLSVAVSKIVSPTWLNHRHAVWDMDLEHVLDGVHIPVREWVILRGIGRPRTCPEMSGGLYSGCDSTGGRTGTARMPIGMYKMGCTLAQPGEYDCTVHMWRRCGLMSNYFDHLFYGRYCSLASCFVPNPLTS